jgi:hypothetical protein
MAAPATANQSRDRGIDLATDATQIARGGMLSISDIAGIPFVRLFPADFAAKSSVFAIVWPML